MTYISKEEKKVPIDDPTGKWSDLTLLPEWEEEYYDVYTARKYGKWVMLKSLKKEYRDQQKYRDMLEREFETRYNLAHPNIVMVNDFEELPTIGKAIITDDVYGYSLRQMIDEKRLTPFILHRLQTQLIDALVYIQENHIIHHPITPDNIIFTEYNQNLKLLNVGYDQTESLSPQDTATDLREYGAILNEVLAQLPAKLPRLKRIARQAEQGQFSSVADLHLALERRSSSQLYIYLILVLLISIILLIWLGHIL